MSGSVTVKDIARQAEVSVGTVSRVLNNHSNVNEEIRQKVLRAAADLGYFRAHGQPAASRSGGRVLKEVGFLYSSSIEETPATVDPYWALIFQGVEAEARRNNIKIIYRTINDLRHKPQLLIAALYEMRLGGILLVGQVEADALAAIQAIKVPAVLVDNYISELSHTVDAILPDNFQGGKLAMEYLFSLGHRRIAFIGGPSESPMRPIYKIYSVQQRWVSYCMAFLDRGLTIDYDLVESGNLTSEGGYQACRRLLERKVDFSAIFCVDDITAIGAMKALREAGRHVPEDISLIGFDGIELGQLVTPALSTICIDTRAMGMSALQTLIIRAGDPEAPFITKLVGTSLVKRDTTMPPRET
ncbi:LacI family transcriptional regulator [Ktedonosporobacter rubrisoli]|uniref:LacI family transcriptional regulator n=1 Tax=Ktedonosporobacter rubrisoli TaxID=2509675 RepID=A0A4P6JPP7_KTERU|nr:LacI family DNA-binding transcriptional regulator [Ktedonosporobacter rubrisoli]QBD77062.1 LacI family transcriptional regulator [Ktedonosporobacter rubrisoli]